MLMQPSEYTIQSSVITDDLPSQSVSLIDEKDTDCLNVYHMAYGDRWNM